MHLSLELPPTGDPLIPTLRSLVTRGRHAEADRLARANRRRTSGRDSQALLALGAEIALGLGRFGTALEKASTALRGIGPRDGLSVSLESARLRALIGLGRFREADALLEERFAPLDPAGVEVSLFRAHVALHSGALVRAAREATSACDRAMSRRQRERLVEALLLRARIWTRPVASRAGCVTRARWRACSPIGPI